MSDANQKAEETVQQQEEEGREEWNVVEAIDRDNDEDVCLCRYHDGAENASCGGTAVVVWQCSQDREGDDLYPLCLSCTEPYFGGLPEQYSYLYRLDTSAAAAAAEEDENEDAEEEDTIQSYKEPFPVEVSDLSLQIRMIIAAYEKNFFRRTLSTTFTISSHAAAPTKPSDMSGGTRMLSCPRVDPLYSAIFAGLHWKDLMNWQTNSIC